MIARIKLRRFVPLAIIALAAGAFFALGLHRYLSLDAIVAERARLDAFVAGHRLLAMGLYALAFTIGIVLCLPVSAILTTLGGYLFGLWIAPPLVLVTMTTGALITFAATRGPLAAIARARAGSHLDRFEHGFREDAFNYLLALRLAPVLPFPLMTLVSALMDVKTRDFALATLIGVTPITIVLASAGNALRLALDAGVDVDPNETVRRLLLSPEALLPIAALMVLAIAPVAYKRVLDRRRLADGKRSD